MIEEYFTEFEQILNSYRFVERIEIQKKIINDSFGIINGILFIGDKRLDFLEVVLILDNNSVVKKKYKYHFRDSDNLMVFRYDNIPHHKRLSTYPHHKHIGGDIIESNEPDLLLILKEIESLM